MHQSLPQSSLFASTAFAHGMLRKRLLLSHYEIADREELISFTCVS